MTEGDQRLSNQNDFQNYIQELKKKIQGRHINKASDKNTIDGLSIQKLHAKQANPSLVY